MRNTDYFCHYAVYQVVRFAKNQKKGGALENNVDYLFEFPRQCIVQKNALSLTQAPMIILKEKNPTFLNFHYSEKKELNLYACKFVRYYASDVNVKNVNNY